MLCLVPVRLNWCFVSKTVRNNVIYANDETRSWAIPHKCSLCMLGYNDTLFNRMLLLPHSGEIGNTKWFKWSKKAFILQWRATSTSSKI